MITAEELFDACDNNNIDVIRQYISEGGDVNANGKRGEPLILYIAEHGYTDCLKELIKAGANVNTVNNSGWTALMLASGYGHTECVRELIAAEADINAKDAAGMTALAWMMAGHMLTGHKYYDDAGLLISAGADIYIRDSYECAAIEYCEDTGIKEQLIQQYWQRINTENAIASAESPIILKGFDTEL